MPNDLTLEQADALVNARHRKEQERDALAVVSEAHDLGPLCELLTGTLDRALRSPGDREVQEDLRRQLGMVIQASERLIVTAHQIRERQARHTG